MKRLLLGVAAAAVFAAFTPANAQVYLGAGPEGAGVQVGPLGVGVGRLGMTTTLTCQIAASYASAS
jgi:hypothetical protein